MSEVGQEAMGDKHPPNVTEKHQQKIQFRFVVHKASSRVAASWLSVHWDVWLGDMYHEERDFEMDQCDLDILVTACQKAVGTIPGFEVKVDYE